MVKDKSTLQQEERDHKDPIHDIIHVQGNDTCSAELKQLKAYPKWLKNLQLKELKVFKHHYMNLWDYYEIYHMDSITQGLTFSVDLWLLGELLYKCNLATHHNVSTC